MGLQQLLEQRSEVLSQQPENAQLRVEVAGLLSELGRTEDAEEQLITASRVYVNQQAYAEAAQVCGQVLAINPAHAEAQGILGMLRQHGLIIESAPISATATDDNTLEDRHSVTIEPGVADPVQAESSAVQHIESSSVRLVDLLDDNIVKRARSVAVDSGTPILVEGQVGDSIFVLLSGRATARCSSTDADIEIQQVFPGDFVGELAFLGDGTRQMTVVADESCEALELPRPLISELAQANRQLDSVLRRTYRERLLLIALRRSPLFDGLHDRIARRFIRNFQPLPVAPQTVVLRQGDAPSGLYLVLLGQLAVFLDNQQGDDPYQIATLGPGDFFGEISLLQGDAVTASVTAGSFCQLLRLPVEAFNHFTERHPRFRAMLADVAEHRRRLTTELLQARA